MTGARRRHALLKQQQQNVANSSGSKSDKSTSHAKPAEPRVINAAPSLEKAAMYGIDDNRPVFSRVMALAGRVFIETIPAWLSVGVMLALIFGGCCSNVFALESIIKVEPASGTFDPSEESWCGAIGSCVGSHEDTREKEKRGTRPKTNMTPAPSRNPPYFRSIRVRRRHRLPLPVRSLATPILLKTEQGPDQAVAGQHSAVLWDQRPQQPCLQLRYIGACPHHPSVGW